MIGRHHTALIHFLFVCFHLHHFEFKFSVPVQRAIGEMVAWSCPTQEHNSPFTSCNDLRGIHRNYSCRKWNNIPNVRCHTYTLCLRVCVFVTEKDLQVPQGPEQPESLGRGAEGDQSAGGHGSDLAAAGRVHPPGPPAHHLHPAGWGSNTHTHTHTHTLFLIIFMVFFFFFTLLILIIIRKKLVWGYIQTIIFHLCTCYMSENANEKAIIQFAFSFSHIFTYMETKENKKTLWNIITWIYEHMNILTLLHFYVNLEKIPTPFFYLQQKKPK